MLYHGPMILLVYAQGTYKTCYISNCNFLHHINWQSYPMDLCSLFFSNYATTFFQSWTRMTYGSHLLLDECTKYQVWIYDSNKVFVKKLETRFSDIIPSCSLFQLITIPSLNHVIMIIIMIIVIIIIIIIILRLLFENLGISQGHWSWLGIYHCNVCENTQMYRAIITTYWKGKLPNHQIAKMKWLLVFAAVLAIASAALLDTINKVIYCRGVVCPAGSRCTGPRPLGVSNRSQVSRFAQWATRFDLKILFHIDNL